MTLCKSSRKLSAAALLWQLLSKFNMLLSIYNIPGNYVLPVKMLLLMHIFTLEKES